MLYVFQCQIFLGERGCGEGEGDRDTETERAGDWPDGSLEGN